MYWVPLSDPLARDDADRHRTVSGRVIRFGWDWSVDIPLWDADGLLPEDPEWLRTELGLSDEVIEALVTWGRDMNSVPDAPDEEPTPAAKLRYRELDRRAQGLVEWLRREFGSRYDVESRPW